MRFLHRRVGERPFLGAVLEQLSAAGWKAFTEEGDAAGAQTGKPVVCPPRPSEEDRVADGPRAGLPDRTRRRAGAASAKTFADAAAAAGGGAERCIPSPASRCPRRFADATVRWRSDFAE
ncbi:hypothetical protein GCM10010446_07420 [Streptomyces enissocaesilis]|uniref:Uncharacterized protein n=1 Tax=Streptomyces enissocaesilis TaxID=332589 RepID=A0ABN3WRI9_9ACTN